MRAHCVRGRGVLLAAVTAVCAAAIPGAAYTRPIGTSAVSGRMDHKPPDGSVAGRPAVSGDGRYVAFSSTGTGLAPWNQPAQPSSLTLPVATSGPLVVDGDEQVYLRDTATGRTQMVSVDDGGVPAWDPMPDSEGRHRSWMSGGLALSDNGRVVAFTSFGWNLAGIHHSDPDPEDLPPRAQVLDTNLSCDVFVRDLSVTPARTERVSVASDGSQAGFDASTASGSPAAKTEESCDSWDPAVSADGRYVAFVSTAANLVERDTNGSPDVFVRDRKTLRTERVSVTSTEQQGTGPLGGNGGDVNAGGSISISADGRFVAFESGLKSLVPGVADGSAHVYVRDRVTGTTELVARALDGKPSAFEAGRPSISGNGRFVVFSSTANDLVPTNGNHLTTGALIYVWDRQLRRTQQVSVTGAGELAAEHDPTWRADQCCWVRPVSDAISNDGRWVSFVAYEPNFDGWPGYYGGAPTSPYGAFAFVYDRSTGELGPMATPKLSNGHTPDAFTVALAPNGRVAAIVSTGTVDGRVTGVAFRIDRGPTLGVSGLAASVAKGRLALSGRLSFAGAVLVDASDPAGDAMPASARALGGDAIGGAVVYRPERGDVLFRFALAALPQTRSAATPTGQERYFPTVGGDPRVEYVAAFTAGGRSYQARASVLPTAGNPPAQAVFGLYQCDEGNVPDCAKVADLRGGLGTTGAEVLMAVPAGLATPAIREGQTLSGLHLWVRSTVPSATPSVDAAPLIDEIRLRTQSVRLPSRRVTVTVAYDVSSMRPATVTAAFTAGRLSVSVPARGGGRHTYTVTVRTCFQTCVSERSVVPA